MRLNVPGVWYGYMSGRKEGDISHIIMQCGYEIQTSARQWMVLLVGVSNKEVSCV